jgi:hypothetical protein
MHWVVGDKHRTVRNESIWRREREKERERESEREREKEREREREREREHEERTRRMCREKGKTILLHT